MLHLSHEDRIILSERETEVVRFISEGYSAKEAARIMDISPRTVERYVENVRMKMHARNSIQMVAKVIAYGLLDKEDPDLPLFMHMDSH